MTAYDKELSARLVHDALEDDERTSANWTAHDYDTHSDAREAIARTRNNLRAMADQLEAAGREIDRLRVDVEAGDHRLAGVLDGTFAVGDGTAQREIERLRAALDHAVSENIAFNIKVADEIKRLDGCPMLADGTEPGTSRVQNDIVAVAAATQVRAVSNGLKVGRLRQDLEERTAERDAALDALANLERILTAIGGYMKHEDQAWLRAARALLKR